MDSISVLMFMLPGIFAFVFSILTIYPKPEDGSSIVNGMTLTFLCSIVSAICWLIFGVTWPAVATTELFVSVAYLWYALFVVFSVFTLVVGIRMLGEGAKQPVLKIRQVAEED